MPSGKTWRLTCGALAIGGVLTGGCEPDCERTLTCESYSTPDGGAGAGAGGMGAGGGSTGGGSSTGGGGGDGPVPALLAPVLELGTNHTCHLSTDRVLKCWGQGDFGQLGNNDSADSSVPAAVVGLVDVEDVCAGDGHSCAVDHAGGVFCWGDNTVNQLGKPGLTQANAPVSVEIPSARSLDCGAEKPFSCAVTTAGELYCWGDNSSGQLGAGNADSQDTPIKALIDQVTQVAAGSFHACALRDDATLWCWGNNYAGQIGNGEATMSAAGNVFAPVQVLDNVMEVSAGHLHTCALRTDGTVWCWGADDFGQAGAFANGDVVDPTIVDQLSSLTSLSVGGYHSCVRGNGDKVWCWGNNDAKQSADSSNTMVQLPTEANVPLVADVAAGWTHTCAVTSQEQVYCWGHNGHGELGDGTETSSGQPVQVLGL